MKKGTKAAVIAAVTCIAVGCVLIGAGTAAGGISQLREGDFSFVHLDGDDVDLDDVLGSVFWGHVTGIGNGSYDGEKTEKGVEVLSGDFEQEIAYTGSLEKLEVKVGVHILEIREGQKLLLSGKNCDRIQCFVKDGTLYVQDVGKNKKYTRVNDRELVLTVPKGICWEEAEINAALGGVEMDVLTAKKAELDADMGNISISSLIVDSLEIDADMGNVELDDAAVRGLDAEANMGSIEFSGTVDGDIDAKAGMGSIELTLRQDISDFDYEITSDMGSVTLDGEDYSGVNTKMKLNHDSGRTLTADSSMGSIDIYFE